MPKESKPIENIELLEFGHIPGKIVGKVVIDSRSHIIGVVRSLMLTLPNAKLKLVVKGLNSEFFVPIEDIIGIGSVIQLSNTYKAAEPIDFNEILPIIKEIKNEISQFIKFYTQRG